MSLARVALALGALAVASDALGNSETATSVWAKAVTIGLVLVVAVGVIRAVSDPGSDAEAES